MTPRFAIRDTVAFGNEVWTVIRYHLVGSHWEIIFCAADGRHRSIACEQLERYVDG
jgi:hypothetical protein